jgi:hypothetical protein
LIIGSFLPKLIFFNQIATPCVSNYKSFWFYSACSFGWWLMADAGLFCEKITAGWLLVADLL